jgi:hypothetical protein
MALLLLANIALGQGTGISSNLKDFEGIWQFVPPEGSNDTTFTAIEFINNRRRLTLFFRNYNKSVHTLGPDIIGFLPPNRIIMKLSDLDSVGLRVYFYRPNPQAPNDSIKYFQEASPSCSALYNGNAIEEELDPPKKGQSNYFTFSFNGRDIDRHEQLHHLPNLIVSNLVRNKKELLKVEAFLNKNFSIIKVSKVYIFSDTLNKTKMYLLKKDPVEIIENKADWLKIKYYPEKNGAWTGKTIEGWIKKSDVE